MQPCKLPLASLLPYENPLHEYVSLNYCPSSLFVAANTGFEQYQENPTIQDTGKNPKPLSIGNYPSRRFLSAPGA